MPVLRAPTENFFPVSSSASWGGRATRAEVNLDAVSANTRAVTEHARQSALIAVVKSNAYGHGAIPVAQTVLNSGATALAVYTVEEGLELRQAGIKAKILLFGPFEAPEAKTIWEARLTPTIRSIEQAEYLQRAAHGDRLPFHVKIDTGLRRAGIAPSEALSFVQQLSGFPALEPEGLFTHFAGADEQAKETTREQLQAFLHTDARLRAAGHSFPMTHVANSAAILDLPETHLDLVRSGIALCGYYPSAEVSRHVELRPALSLVSVVSRVQRLNQGTGVGYGHEFRCSRPSVIALAPIGYADGLPRTLGLCRGQVLVHGKAAPIVGRMSMDQITIDVTDIPEVHTGDPVTIIGRQDGEQQSADDLARLAGTISYEILSGVATRVPRLYVRDGNVVGWMGLKSDYRVLDPMRDGAQDKTQADW